MSGCVNNFPQGLIAHCDEFGSAVGLADLKRRACSAVRAVVKAEAQRGLLGLRAAGNLPTRVARKQFLPVVNWACRGVAMAGHFFAYSCGECGGLHGLRQHQFAGGIVMHASQCELAAFNLVHDYPGGAQALGPMIGKLGTTLSHEVNPNQAGYKLGLRDMEKLSVLTGNPAVLNALAASMGYFPPIPMLALPPENTTLNDLMRQCASVAEKGAKVLVDFQMRASDMEISPNDAASVMAAIEETVQALTGFRLALQEHVAQKDRP